MKRLFLFLSVCLMSIHLFAYDFEVGGIYYNITSHTSPYTVAVTHSNDYSYTGSITIPASVTYNGINYTVTSVEDGVFMRCTGLTNILCDASNPNYSSVGGVLFNKDQTTLIQYPIGKTETSYTIPNTVNVIGSHAFNWAKLTNITISNSVKRIGFNAFGSCKNLASVIIGNSVTHIENQAFCGCESLTNITIPNSVTSIGKYAFRDCSSLTSMNIPNIEASIGGGVFYDCINLMNITLPPSLTSISNMIFFGCTNLTDINIPNSVTKIGVSAFRDCSSLTSIVIPTNVTSIGQYAFTNCSNLSSVTCLPVNPPVCGANKIFNGCSLLAEIYVPCESLRAYQTANVWKDYSLQGITECNTDLENQVLHETIRIVSGEIICPLPLRIYNLMGQDITAQNGYLSSGIYIVCTEKESVKVVID